MTKHVFRDAEEVCHIWAADRCKDDHGRSANCRFDGDTIYSYGHHYVLGQFYRDKRGKRVAVVINTYRYSVTTATHIQAALGAVRGLGVKLFRNSVPGRPQDGYHAMIADHLAELRELRTKRVGAEHVQHIHDVAMLELEAFRKQFKLKRTVHKDTKKTLAEALKAAARRDEAKAKRDAWTPEQVAKHEEKLERAKAQRERAKQTKEAGVIIGQIERFVKNEDEREPGSISNYWNVPSELRSDVVETLPEELRQRYVIAWPLAEAHLKRISEEKAEKERIDDLFMQRAAELLPEAEQAWRDGLDVDRYANSVNGDEHTRLLATAWRNRDYSSPTLLRMHDGRIETSRGAMVTVKAGRVLFELYQRVMAGFAADPFISDKPTRLCGGRYEKAYSLNTTIDTWYPDGDIRVEHYRLDLIRVDGAVKVGCHFLTKVEIDKFIEQQGWAKQSALHAVK